MASTTRNLKPGLDEYAGRSAIRLPRPAGAAAPRGGESGRLEAAHHGGPDRDHAAARRARGVDRRASGLPAPRGTPRASRGGRCHPHAPAGTCRRRRAASRRRAAPRAPRARRRPRHRSAGPPWARRRRRARAHTRSDSALDRPLRARDRCTAAAAPRRELRKKSSTSPENSSRNKSPSRSSMRAVWPPGRMHQRLRLQALARASVHQRGPRREHALEQQFDLPAALLGRVNPRRHHPGVVEHQEIAPARAARANRELQIAPRPARAVERRASGWRSAASRAAGQ